MQFLTPSNKPVVRKFNLWLRPSQPKVNLNHLSNNWVLGWHNYSPFNPLSPDIQLQILKTDLHTFS